MKKILLFCLIIVSFASLPVFASDEVAYDMTAEEFIAANWQKAFVTGKTSYQIQGRMVSQPTDVYNPLELVSYHVENDGESVILTGTLGEEWVAPVSKVVNTYTKTDGSALTAEDFTSSINSAASLLLSILFPSVSYLSNIFFNFSFLISSRRIPPLILDKSTFSPFFPNLNSSDIPLLHSFKLFDLYTK